MTPFHQFDCEQYTPRIIAIQKQERALLFKAFHTDEHKKLVIILNKGEQAENLFGILMKKQQSCFSLNNTNARTDKYWVTYHPNGWPGTRGGW